jgi:predicted transcriptional regulator
MDKAKVLTYKILKESREVLPEAKEKLKAFTKMKKTILNALKEGEKTVPELTDELRIPGSEIVYTLMSLLKYGSVCVSRLDDNDEYFYYKLKNNG